MSRTLNLIDILLTTGRHLFQMGRLTEALQPLTKLAAFRKLPRLALEELHGLLGEIYLQKQEFKNARRHLTAAMAANPRNGEYPYLLAIAIEEDDEADKGRAEAYFERAIQLEPAAAAYWVDFAAHLFTHGKSKEALKAIRNAYALGINDVDIVGTVAAILRREEHYDEATTKLRAALFQNHGNARFRRLWDEHQFAMICVDQEAARKDRSPKLKKPVILPFEAAPSRGKFADLGGRTIRIDQAHESPEPKATQPQPQLYRRPPKG